MKFTEAVPHHHHCIQIGNVGMMQYVTAFCIVNVVLGCA